MADNSARDRSSIEAVVFDWGDTLVRYPGFSTDAGGHLEAVEVFFQWFEQAAECQCLAAEGTTSEAFVDAYCRAAQVQFALMAATGIDQPMGTRLVTALHRLELSRTRVRDSNPRPARAAPVLRRSRRLRRRRTNEATRAGHRDVRLRAFVAEPGTVRTSGREAYVASNHGGLAPNRV